jgi:hypothetical protein
MKLEAPSERSSPMIKHPSIWLGLCGLAAFSASALAETTTPPNIVLLISDDDDYDE